MSVRDQYADRRARVVERTRNLVAVRSGQEGQAALPGEREIQAAGHASRAHDTAASAIDEDDVMEDAPDEDASAASLDALTRFRQRATLWRLSDCTTLAQQLGDEGHLFTCP
ncbi:hypothetical protein psal_cds_437 [Pandoravirus salinus]|uniref:Uncharacterized protein n=1 Tax=Pandoravirus salinus TaxID=1349410 RepID=S4VUZ2_9VIRU|nr:hypothetical protein psal_cds_437 [Pandoravirus salinus]AGO84183.1 hypothetical protein psal_cds_437 [Pandoravirus salinus]